MDSPNFSTPTPTPVSPQPNVGPVPGNVDSYSPTPLDSPTFDTSSQPGLSSPRPQRPSLVPDDPSADVNGIPKLETLEESARRLAPPATSRRPNKKRSGLSRWFFGDETASVAAPKLHGRSTHIHERTVELRGSQESQNTSLNRADRVSSQSPRLLPVQEQPETEAESKTEIVTDSLTPTETSAGKPSPTTEKPGMWIAGQRTACVSQELIPFSAATQRSSSSLTHELEVTVAKANWIPGERPTDSGELLLNVELTGVQTLAEGSIHKAAWSAQIDVRNSNGYSVLDRDLGRTAEVTRNSSGHRKSTYRVKVSSPLPAGEYSVRVTVRDDGGSIPAIGTTTLVIK